MFASLVQIRRRVGSGAVLKLFSAAVIDQVLLSGANFVAGFILIRFTSDHDYGLYVLVQSAMILLTTAQAAWLSGPLAVVAARKSPAERRTMVGAVRSSQRRVLLWAVLTALIVPLAAYLLGLTSGAMALLLAGALVCGWATLRREYLRSVLLFFSRPHSLVRADTAYVVVLVLGVGAATLSKGAAVLWAVATLVTAALAGAALADRSLARDPGWVRGDAGPVLREMRTLAVWSTLGALTYWVFTQSSNYVLAGRLDLKAVADVNAIRLLLMPAIVLTIGVQNLLMPTAAVWYAEVGLTRLVRRLLVFIAGMVLLDLVYLAVVWAERGWLTGTLLHKHVEARDELILLWALVALIGVVRDVLLCALFALGMMKSLAGQTALSAAVALLLTWFGLSWWGAPAMLIGQIAGELVNLVGMLLLLRQAQRNAELYSVT
jgi:O-antigen/teichoic acid export membrane protein